MFEEDSQQLWVQLMAIQNEVQNVAEASSVRSADAAAATAANAESRSLEDNLDWPARGKDKANESWQVAARRA